MAELKMTVAVLKVEDGDVVVVEVQKPITRQMVEAIDRQIKDVTEASGLSRVAWILVPQGEFELSTLDPSARAELRRQLDMADAVIDQREAAPLNVWDDRTERSRYGRDLERGDVTP